MLPESSTILLYVILGQLTCSPCLSSYFQKENFHHMYLTSSLDLAFNVCLLQTIKQNSESSTELLF